ncbi:MAG: Cu(I)-responsive transcriptional regulator [Thermoanaerobaculia bacterium]
MLRRSRPTLELSDAKEQGYYNIGQASELSGVSAKMIRHYESIGVIPPAERTFSNYRIYSQNDVHTLQFVRRARALGFSMKQIQTLLGLWQQHRPSRDVKRLALEHVTELEEKIRELEAMKRTLQNLAEHCHGDHKPECPILDDLAGL